MEECREFIPRLLVYEDNKIHLSIYKCRYADNLNGQSYHI